MNAEHLDLAAAGFAGGDRYERARPGYGTDVVDALCGALGIRPGTEVLDLAAGTGKLTRALVARGAAVVAVEPVPGMRAELTARLPTLDVRSGTAERLPLPDAAVDAVTVAQAFHWFDGPRAVEEIARVLRGGGRLGLVWNVMDRSVDWVDGMQRRIHEHRGRHPWYAGHAWREAFEGCELFTPLRHTALRTTQRVDLDGLRERVSSISFVTLLSSGERQRLLDDVVAIARRAGLGGRGAPTFSLPYVTDVFWCERTARSGGSAA